MKIIGTDKLNRPTVDDRLIAEHTDEYFGNEIVKLLNQNSYSGRFYTLVRDDYKLHEFVI